MKLKQFGAITLLSLPFTVLSYVSSPLLPNFSIFSESTVVAQTSEPQKVEADRLFEQGEQQYDNSQFQAAIQSWQQTLSIYQEIGDRQGEAKSRNNLGIAYYLLGEYQKAIDFHQLSLEIAREIGYRRVEADSLNNLGNAYYSLGEYQKAIDFHQLSLEIEREIGNHRGEADSLGNLGLAYYLLGEYQKAIDFHQLSLEIKREIGNRLGEANSLNNLGIAYDSLGEYQKAIDFHQLSLEIQQQIGNHRGEANSLNNLGNAYYSLGEYQKAIDFHQLSLEIQQQIGNRRGEAASLGNLGLAYDSLGEYQKAIDFHQLSLEIQQQIGNRLGEANSLGNLGIAYDSLGEYQKAIDFHQLSLEIQQQIGNHRGEANSLNNLGNAYYSLGEYQKAIDFHQLSLEIKQQIGNRLGEANSLNNLGIAYYSLGEYQKAIDFHQLSLEIKREIGNRRGEADSLGNLGVTFFEFGNLTAAETHLQQGIKAHESLRVGLEDNNKISIFDTHSRTYRTLQQVLVAQNKTNEALEIAERRSAHALVELLKQDSASQSDTQLPKYPSLEQIKQIAQQQDATLVTYSLVFDRQLYIWVISPTGKIEFRTVDIPQDTSLKELVTNGQACILLEQCRSETNQTLPTAGDLVKLNDDQFEEPWQVVEVDAQQGILKVKLEGFEGEPIERPITDVVEIVDAFNRQHLQQLHQLLIQPIADLLPKNENERIVFIPHEELFLVPFPALQDEDGNYLIEKHTILTAPSIEVLSLTREKRQQLPDSVQGALVVGNPTMPIVKTSAGKTPEQLSNLPHAEIEAKEIAKFLNTQPLTGNNATKAAIVPKLPQARFIHLATHGVLDDFKGIGTPGAIALAPSSTGEVNDGLLTAGELFEIKLNAELVVLSACKTGQGEITSDGVIGLSRSLIAAGVPSIIVSLWSVPDAPTADLMTRFYQHLAQNNNKAEALRQAMLDTMKEHPNPKDWAAFTLIGEP
ncbi:MAG: CHAT domain-containing protein [Symploca sp. SIO2D2]|nr:CHAT domain-containing protein [Symploca sp. SIO2D2]